MENMIQILIIDIYTVVRYYKVSSIQCSSDSVHTFLIPLLDFSQDLCQHGEKVVSVLLCAISHLIKTFFNAG